MDRYPIRLPKRNRYLSILTAFIIKDGQRTLLTLERNRQRWAFIRFLAFPLDRNWMAYLRNLRSIISIGWERGSRSNPEITSFRQDYDLAISWQDRSYPIVRKHIFSHIASGRFRFDTVLKQGEQPTCESTVWITPRRIFVLSFLLNLSRRFGRLFGKWKIARDSISSYFYRMSRCFGFFIQTLDESQRTVTSPDSTCKNPGTVGML